MRLFQQMQMQKRDEAIRIVATILSDLAELAIDDAQETELMFQRGHVSPKRRTEHIEPTIDCVCERCETRRLRCFARARRQQAAKEWTAKLLKR